jgi:hypothetical protein
MKNIIAKIKNKINPTSSTDALLSEKGEISTRREFLSKAVISGTGVIIGGTATATTTITGDGIYFNDNTTQNTAIPDPTGSAGKVLSYTGTELEWVNPGSGNSSRVFPNERQFTYPYDFSSDPFGSNSYSLTTAWENGYISAANSGIVNSTSHLGANKKWHTTNLIELAWDRNNFTKGLKITVPANTEIVVVGTHSGAWGVVSLTDADTGEGVCNYGCDNNNRFYNAAGHSGYTFLLEAFGNSRITPHSHPIYLPVPKLDSDKEYIIVRGQHSLPRSDSGWMSSLAFNTNPHKVAILNAVSVHWKLNGGDYIHWEQNGWFHTPLAKIGTDLKTIKVPISPGAGGRKVFFIAHASHYQYIRKITFNGKRYALEPADYSSIVMKMISRNHYHFIDEFYIPESELPAEVLSIGGCIDITFDRTFGSHYYYFSGIGTYLPGQ